MTKTVLSVSERARIHLRALVWRDERFTDGDLLDLARDETDKKIDDGEFRRVFLVELAARERVDGSSKYERSRTKIRGHGNSVDERLTLYGALVSSGRPLCSDDLIPLIYPKDEVREKEKDRKKKIGKKEFDKRTRSWSGSIGKLMAVLVELEVAKVEKLVNRRGKKANHWSVA